MTLTICPKCKGVHTETETIYDRDIEKLMNRLGQIKRQHKITIIGRHDGIINAITFKYEDLPEEEEEEITCPYGDVECHEDDFDSLCSGCLTEIGEEHEDAMRDTYD